MRSRAQKRFHRGRPSRGKSLERKLHRGVEFGVGTELLSLLLRAPHRRAAAQPLPEHRAYHGADGLGHFDSVRKAHVFEPRVMMRWGRSAPSGGPCQRSASPPNLNDTFVAAATGNCAPGWFFPPLETDTHSSAASSADVSLVTSVLETLLVLSLLDPSSRSSSPLRSRLRPHSGVEHRVSDARCDGGCGPAPHSTRYARELVERCPLRRNRRNPRNPAQGRSSSRSRPRVPPLRGVSQRVASSQKD